MNYLIASLVLLSCAAPAHAAAPADLVQAILIADARTIQPGQPFRLGVLFTIKPDWHIYWKNAGDAGLPASIKFDLPEGFKAGELQWPAPIQFDQPGSDTAAYGYTTGVLLFLTVTPPADASGVITLAAHANWLACEKDSIPGTADLQLKLPVHETVRAGNAAAFKLWQSRIPGEVEKEAAIESVKSIGQVTADDQAAPFSIQIQWKEIPENVEWFPEPGPNIYLDQLNLSRKGALTRIGFTARPLRGETPTPDAMKSVLAFTDAQGERKSCVITVKLRSPTTLPATRPATLPTP